MASGYWDQVRASGLEVPPDRPLDDLTAELTAMLGSTDPLRRDRTAYEVLAGWISRGVYDDLLPGLGDGMVAGLRAGVGEAGTDSVFRRSFSALVLTECLERDNRANILTPDRVLTWGDRIAAWLLDERDTRGFVKGKGWAHALAHGADAISALADSTHVELTELTVLLDVLGERVLIPRASRWRRARPTAWLPQRCASCSATSSRWSCSSLGPSASPMPRGPRWRTTTPIPSPCSPRPSCARSTCSCRWATNGRATAPTNCSCWSMPCASATRRTWLPAGTDAPALSLRGCDSP
ncbi:DUF2785 domain-containing protein [Nocardioides alcanivorans]|uniref:DUF2785 domain-containing protein n=1 Tax=Nocardioides alcanivorans TaxID=2897352 RepID=UPI001F20836E|nr:DUF2785 domain-containing protein [Nocardioides alcanivorans]